jgi:hypothetical protein
VLRALVLGAAIPAAATETASSASAISAPTAPLTSITCSAGTTKRSHHRSVRKTSEGVAYVDSSDPRKVGKASHASRISSTSYPRCSRTRHRVWLAEQK